jgi:hypothetical protein
MQNPSCASSQASHFTPHPASSLFSMLTDSPTTRLLPAAAEVAIFTLCLPKIFQKFACHSGIKSCFFLNTRAAYHCIKTKKKLVQCSVTTQMKRTSDGHRPANQLNMARTINSNMNYSHTTQPKRRAVGMTDYCFPHQTT